MIAVDVQIENMAVAALQNEILIAFTSGKRQINRKGILLQASSNEICFYASQWAKRALLVVKIDGLCDLLPTEAGKNVKEIVRAAPEKAGTLMSNEISPHVLEYKTRPSH